MKSGSCVVVLAILNEMLRRLADAIPQIELATRELRQMGISTIHVEQ
jgi:hypothetical protein